MITVQKRILRFIIFISFHLFSNFDYILNFHAVEFQWEILHGIYILHVTKIKYVAITPSLVKFKAKY